MSHYPADRWADLHRLPEAEREVMNAHAQACLSCAALRDRVAAAGRTLSDIARTPAPELSWDLLGARLHWTVSSEIKRRERETESRQDLVRRSWRWILGAGVAMVAGVAALVWLRQPVRLAVPSPAPAAASTAGAPEGVPVSPGPAVEAAVVTFLQGEATLDGGPLFVDSPIHAGVTLRTRSGRVGLQFGERSAFVLEPDSTLELVRLDDDDVALRVKKGAVGVDLARRRDGQHFTVLAGPRQVEVRGTAFRVAHEREALDVAVARGKVAVVEGSDAVEVAAGSWLTIPAGGHLAGLLPRSISDREARELAGAVRVPVVPSWTGAPEARARSAVLRVAAGPKARVRIDGVAVGVGTLSVRAPAGRYLVEVGSASQWVELDAGVATATRMEETPRSERPGQLDKQLAAHRDAISQCAPYKQDLDFHAEIEVELRVAADGAVNYVTLVRGSGYRDVESCVLEQIRSSFTFPPGTGTTVRKKIRL